MWPKTVDIFPNSTEDRQRVRKYIVRTFLQMERPQSTWTISLMFTQNWFILLKKLSNYALFLLKYFEQIYYTRLYFYRATGMKIEQFLKSFRDFLAIFVEKDVDVSLIKFWQVVYNDFDQINSKLNGKLGHKMIYSDHKV